MVQNSGADEDSTTCGHVALVLCNVDQKLNRVRCSYYYPMLSTFVCISECVFSNTTNSIYNIVLQCRYCALHDRGSRVGQTTFKMVVKALTARQQKHVEAVDYVVAELIHDNLERLVRLVKGVVTHTADQKELLLELEQVFRYVKSSFAKSLGTSACPTQDLEYALGISSEGVEIEPDADIDYHAALHLRAGDRDLEPALGIPGAESEPESEARL